MTRVIDVLVAVIALIISFPVGLVIAIVIVLESPAQPVFRQVRVGRGDENFVLFKFRSMVPEAARVGGFATGRGDPRVTRVGKLIRATSLDEIPQLWNVLRGDMSLVGPRPDVPAQRELYSDVEWQKRTSVRPGITGLAQVELRSDATHEQRLALDLEFVETHSLRGYVSILARTLVMVTRRLAH